jgi:hypothetical protein
MKNRTILLCLTFFAMATMAHAQIPVAMAPPIHFQFLNSGGQPLANGKIFTYQAGTTNLQNTYVDASGTTQNPDPIPLDSTGSPSNGSVPTGIFLSSVTWKFVAYDVNNVFQWSVDNVSTYFALLNSTNTWTATQTFSGQLIDLLTDNQMLFGTPGNQTTLDFPPPAGNVTLHFPNIGDTIVARTTTDTLTNKTLTSPIENSPIVNGIAVANTPGTYTSIQNANPIGTGCDSLATIINVPGQATFATTSQTGGILGIAVANCGITGFVTIQQSGGAFCFFDGATATGDYVQNSSTTGGDCHDVPGGVYPPSGQVIGRVLSTNATSGDYALELFGPEIQAAPVIKHGHLTGPTITGSTTTGFAVTWSGGAFADTNYSPNCAVFGTNPTNLTFNGFTTKTTTGATFDVTNGGSTVNALSIDCTAVHD